MKWPITRIHTPDGPKEAIAPIIISASRATDIPAFHSEWFAARLAAGYCVWTNPFNRREQYVSFDRARAFVFWTKNAAPIFPAIRTLDAKRLTYYFQFTLNDYEGERLEPHVPPLQERIETFKELARRIGKERVIWRFDPLILTDRIPAEVLVAKVRRVGDMLAGSTAKLVISFADIAGYAKVRRNLASHHVSFRDFDAATMRQVAAAVAELAKAWDMSVGTCCEAIDLSSLGIQHNRCIDDELLLRLSEDQELTNFLRPVASTTQDLFGDSTAVASNRLKDTGQRDICGCIASKDIGAYNTCPHMCLYCYANTSNAAVTKALSGASNQSASIGCTWRNSEQPQGCPLG